MNLRADAVGHVVQASETAFPEIHARFGARGRDACAEDIGFHLDFLRPTLETGDIAPFIGYLGWLVQVLESRGVPQRSLLRSLDDLAGFFQDRLGEPGRPVVAALGAGAAALRQGITAPGYDSPCPVCRDEAAPYAAAALLADREQAMSLLESALDREHSVPLVAVHVIQPAMYEVGRLWQQNRVSVAQEHLATALSESWLAQGAGRPRPVPDNGLRALFACLAGNHHVLGLHMVADAFEAAGWTTNCLGANTGLEALVEQVRAFRPHLAGLSATLPQHLRGLREAVGRLREVFGDACPRIAVGGLVINQFPRLADWVGAEVLGADAVSAAAAAAKRFPGG